MELEHEAHADVSHPRELVSVYLRYVAASEEDIAGSRTIERTQ
jgi:hypothetical protein